MTWYYWAILFLGSGILTGIARLIWQASKRDSKLDLALQEVQYNKGKIVKLEVKWKDQEDGLKEKIGSSRARIIDIEKDLVQINANQKNLLHSINVQNKQVLNLITRLESNHEKFLDGQSHINEKLETAINVIKDTLINNGHSSCIFYKKGINEIKSIVGTNP